MSEILPFAPGWPGISPRWTSSAKTGVGTSLSATSPVWFTLSHGIFNEIYYPRVDQACIRDMGLIITDGQVFFSEEKRHARSHVHYLDEGVPAYKIINTCIEGRYHVEKLILTDPLRATVLQSTRFVPLKGKLEDYRLFVLLAPHIGNQGSGNTGWIGDYKGVPMMLAQREANALALASSCNWLKRSVGFSGFSDGWQDLMKNKQLTACYDRAENGNIAFCGEVDLKSCDGQFVLSLGFGRNPAEAGLRASASLEEGFDAAKARYIEEWRSWQKSLKPVKMRSTHTHNLHSVSAAVLRAHEAKNIPGGLIASLSIPWGFSKSDADLGGYHLAWPRDLVEAAGGLLAAGAYEDVRRILFYLRATQEAEGYWSQNMWLDGTPYWSGVQMDETALPILLVDMARREKVFDKKILARLWPMVRKAAGFIVCNGPVTLQDRWEEDAGYSPFTLAAEIAALLAAADMADIEGESSISSYLRETADVWNDGIERWIYVKGTELAQQHRIEGYYVRIAPPEVADAASPLQGFVPIKNRPPGQDGAPAAHIISPDALALVRFGLRSPDDPRILNSIKIIDHLLKAETPQGPSWYRYNDDGYGEHESGEPFDGTGIGRPWPLLTGERAHYELAAGRRKKAEDLLRTLETFANEWGLIPEQIWDKPDMPDRELFFGRPSGSAMPLVWAHAEYLKLRRSLQDDCVYDLPPQTTKRYLIEKKNSSYSTWRFNHKCRTIPRGKTLRLEVLAPAIVHWSPDGWHHVHDTKTRDTGLGLHVADLVTENLETGSEVVFTFFWTDVERWEQKDFVVLVDSTAESE